MTEATPRAGWQRGVEWTAALALAALWFGAGIWKLSDLTATQVRMTQALVPRSLSLAVAAFFGAAETFAGILLLAPRWRRWGALLSFGLLAAFMAYIGIHYRALVGADCSCFPWLKRAVGPMFFAEDAAFMVLAVLAGLWARPSQGFGKAALALAAVIVLGVGLQARSRTLAKEIAVPPSIAVDGKQVSLREGRIFLFFFNPYCPHCFQAAEAMSRLNWQAKVIGLPTQSFEEGRTFFVSAGFPSVPLSPDTQKLRETFHFQDVPYAAAIEDGRLRQTVVFFDEPDLSKNLRQIGFVR
jgi:uncharacterized membrane protein YphA (DoxX/SURF4 family)